MAEGWTRFDAAIEPMRADTRERRVAEPVRGLAADRDDRDDRPT